MAFVKATKKKTYLRLALMGPAGQGKSFTALRIASAIGKKVAGFDTERGSLKKYSGDPNPDGGYFDFDVEDQMTDFSVDNYIKAIHEAVQGGYDVLVIDSLSHAWAGQGGILEFVDNKKGDKNTNNFTAWRDATPKHNKLVDALLTAPIHIIVTMRTKMEYVQEKDEKGKTVIRKVGLQPVQREGLEYEFDVVGDMDDSTFYVSKTRCSPLKGKRFYEPGKDIAKILMTWLQQGVAEAPAPSPAPASGAPAPQPAPAPASPAPVAPPAETAEDQHAAYEALRKWVIQAVEQTFNQPAHDQEIEKLANEPKLGGPWDRNTAAKNLKLLERLKSKNTEELKMLLAPYITIIPF